MARRSGIRCVAGQHECEQRGRDHGDRDDRGDERPATWLCRFDAEGAPGVLDERAARRIAPVRFFRERSRHDVLEPGRRRGRFLEVGEEDRGLGRSREGRASGQALVQEARERILVGASVDLLSLDLLGSDVRRRPERQAGVESRRLLGEPPREPEVRQVDMTTSIEEHVRRFDVPMDEPGLVGGVERRRHLLADLDGASCFELLLRRE